VLLNVVVVIRRASGKMYPSPYGSRAPPNGWGGGYGAWDYMPRAPPMQPVRQPHYGPPPPPFRRSANGMPPVLNGGRNALRNGPPNGLRNGFRNGSRNGVSFSKEATFYGDELKENGVDLDDDTFESGEVHVPGRLSPARQWRVTKVKIQPLEDEEGAEAAFYSDDPYAYPPEQPYWQPSPQPRPALSAAIPTRVYARPGYPGYPGAPPPARYPYSYY